MALKMKTPRLPLSTLNAHASTKGEFIPLTKMRTLLLLSPPLDGLPVSINDCINQCFDNVGVYSIRHGEGGILIGYLFTHPTSFRVDKMYMVDTKDMGYLEQKSFNAKIAFKLGALSILADNTQCSALLYGVNESLINVLNYTRDGN